VFAAQLWQAMQLDMLTAVYVFLVAIICVWASRYTPTIVTPSVMGLIMSAAVQAVRRSVLCVNSVPD
jgi:hypothetical protein